MLVLKEILLPENVSKEEKINLSFDKGFHLFEYEQKYIFDLFTLKNQVLLDGEVFLDDELLLPNLDDNKRLILLVVKSKVVVLSLCLNLTLDEKEKFIKLQEDLATLKDLPLTNQEEKKEKIIRIFEVLKNHQLTYVLVDFNLKINDEYENLIIEVMNEYLQDFIILGLDKLVEEKQESKILFKLKAFIENVKTKYKAKQALKPKKEKPIVEVKVSKTSNPFNRLKALLLKHKELMLKILKYNIYSFLLELASIIFSLLFVAIAPLQFYIEEFFMGIFLIASSVLFFVISISVILSIFDFLDKESSEFRPRKIITIVYSEIVIFLASGLMMLIFYILGKFNLLFELDAYEMIYTIPAFVILAIFIVIPFLAKPLRKLFNLIKNKIFLKKAKKIDDSNKK